VLADEPTASLDDENATLAIELLLATCTDSTLVVATHDPRLIQRFSAVASMATLDAASFDTTHPGAANREAAGAAASS
jgi:ABC-type lipoprotein export system ATPase subunit